MSDSSKTLIAWPIEGKPMTSFSNTISRRAWMLGAAGAAIASPFISRSPASAAGIPNIRYATGGGVGVGHAVADVLLASLQALHELGERVDCL